MAEIVLDDVTKRFRDGFEAVKDIDLEIADGEFMILVGPSGCGKSTALRMIAGLEDITEGELLIGGDVVNETAPKDRDIAMVFQNYALYPHMTVRENMAFPLKLAEGPDRRRSTRKVEEAAKILDLEQHLDRKPANLSGGQRQRVAMGRAIVRDPKAFLMDEPLSNLDAKLRVQMRTEVSRLQADLGTTTVYVTHDQTEAMTLGDRVAVMRAGVLQQVGAPAELYDHPANLFVAGFIGSPAMNFMPATVEGDSVKLPLGDVPLSESCERSARRSRQGDRRRAARELRGRLAGRRRQRPRARRSRATIDLLESMGSEQVRLLHGRVRGRRSRRSSRSSPRTPARARCPAAASGPGRRAARRRRARSSGARRPSSGSTSTKLHLFDPSRPAQSLRRGRRRGGVSRAG